MKQLINISTLVIIFSLAIACQKDDDASSLSPEQRINQFIEESMKSIYFWADQVKEINPDLNQKPTDFLKALRYQEDQWSYVEEGEEEETSTRSSVDGRKHTFGYKIQFYQISEQLICGMILYVHKNSPAEMAGLKRGDLIVYNNGKQLTKENYTDIVNAETLNLQLGIIRNDTLFLSQKEYKLSKSTVEQNPILLDTILQIDQKKIGYLVYSNFYDNQSTHLTQLSQTIRKIKNADIEEFILDLRYNIGGTETAAQRLCSLLAPETNVQNEDILIRKNWNSTYQKKLSDRYFTTKFDADVLGDNLNLQKIYILTSKHTASASEVVISGLRPYIPQMTIIGTTTNGKYVGMNKTTPDDEELKKWTLWPVSFTYTNAKGESVKGGITPTFHVEEYHNFLPPFGSPLDPLLKKALTIISGEELKTISKSTRYTKSNTINWKIIEEIRAEPLFGIQY